jgi:hypothetical protein
MRTFHRLMIVIGASALVVMPAIASTDCEDAVDNYNRRKRDLLYSIPAYLRCVQSSRGHNDCSSEFNRVRSEQDDFERAVRGYRSECE